MKVRGVSTVSLRALVALAGLAGCGTDATPMTTTPTMMLPVVQAPAEVAARARVRFALTGGGAFVVYRGRSCSTFEIEREVAGGSFERVPLDLGVTCVCECPSPGAPASIGLGPLEAMSPYEVVWDGRGMVFVERPVDCATRSFSVRGIVQERAGGLQPLAAGRYRVTFAVVDTVPSGCMNLMEGYWCPPQNNNGAPEPGPFRLCPGRRVSATFELPESGELTVPVTAR